MKKIHTINIDDGVYKEFQMYSLIIGKSVSALIEEYMKETIKKQKEN